MYLILFVFIKKLRMSGAWFPNRKGGIFRSGKATNYPARSRGAIKGLCGGVLMYAAQARPQIDTARAEKKIYSIASAM
ncbi:MAG: hypothetical protein C0399_00895 [Syntrophus sp. (in: bacteria)]|nr:hypothetical protein [Syntrophus sp. (in: bacteria)]